MKVGPIYFDTTSPKVEIIAGLETWSRFSRAYNVDGVGRVELDVEVAGGRTRAVAIRIFEPDDATGVHGLTLANTSVQLLLEQATVAATWLANAGAAGDTVLRSGTRNVELKA